MAIVSRSAFHGGFTLAEVIIASGILAMVIGSMATLSSSAQKTSNFTDQRNQAHALTLAGVDEVKAIRDENWRVDGFWLGNGTHKFNLTDSAASQAFMYDKTDLTNPRWRVVTASDVSSCVVAGTVDWFGLVSTLSSQLGTCSPGLIAVQSQIVSEVSGVVRGLVEIIKVQATDVAGSGQEFHRYITLAPFNPTTSGKDYLGNPCSSNCDYNHQAITDQATKQPVVFSDTINPPAMLVHVVVTWQGGADGRQEAADTVLTNWRSDG